MKFKKVISAVSAAAISLTAAAAVVPAVTTNAENPIVQTSFTPDPAPVIFGDELWVFTGRDRNADNDFYYMTGWQAFSTTDMKNWTNHGCFLEDDDFSWCNENDAWASQCIERNGKYYFYFTTTNKSGGGRAVGVAVADDPEGPYKDVLGKPLCGPNWDYIDPTVMIDDDGQAWLMFGNPTCYYVKLKEDMITLDGEIMKFDMTTQAFGEGKNGSAYGEGPWITKHGNLYYLVYAGFYGSDGGESICYSYGPSVTGPWTFGGKITPESNCFTTHGGTIDYKGHSYLFYHKNGLPGGGSFKRSAAVEEFTYNSDGTIPMIKPTDDGPSQLEAFDPYRKVEAETGSWFSGLEVEPAGNGSQAVSMINSGDYIKVSGVDFGKGATSFTASAASATDGGKIELHLDSANGPIVGTVTVGGTDGWKNWKEFTGTVSGATGKHDLFLRFSGGDGFLMNVDWWKFEGSDSSAQTTTQTPSVTTPPSSDVTPSGSELIRETFESGVGKFSGRGSASVASSSDAKFAGSKSLYVSGREASWNGAVMDVPSTVKSGSAYSFSVNVMCPTANKKNLFYLTLSYKDSSGETQYDKIARGSCLGGNWIQLSNTGYQLPAGATDMQVYVETDAGRSDFYIDDFVIAAKGTKISGAGCDYMLTPGDVSCDGRIDAFDLVLARKGLLKDSYKSETSRTNTDADQSGTVEVNDLVLIAEFALGRISEFPDNSPEPPADVKVPYDYDPAVSYKEAPASYYSKDGFKGKLINETYTGINGTKKLNVYLPPDYDESKKYNIFYLMHGGGENENVLVNDSDKFYVQCLVDHMIQNGEIDPMIVVFPTFNGCPDGAGDVWDEMKRSIVPFVEGKYSTYAEDTTPEGLEASRMHRAYGGFSMGGGSTWNVLINDNDYFAYYMPLSGHCWGGATPILNVMKNHKYKDSTYIFAATGTEDIAYGNMCNLINELKKDPSIKYTSDFSQGNFYFLEAPGKTHWWGFVKHYIYDGLPCFFRE